MAVHYVSAAAPKAIAYNPSETKMGTRLQVKRAEKNRNYSSQNQQTRMNGARKIIFHSPSLLGARSKISI